MDQPPPPDEEQPQDKEPAPRKSKGRQKIQIVRIQRQGDLYATFSKRRVGIYKKASELCTLCGVDIGLIIFTFTNNPYSFFHPSMASMLQRHINPNHAASEVDQMLENRTRVRIQELNQILDQVLDQKNDKIDKGKQIDVANPNLARGWWPTSLEEMSREQMNGSLEWLQDLHSHVESRMEELRISAGPSSVLVPMGRPTAVTNGEDFDNNLLTFVSSVNAENYNVFGSNNVNAYLSGSSAGLGYSEQLPAYASDPQNYLQHSHGLQYGQSQVATATDPFLAGSSSSYHLHQQSHGLGYGPGQVGTAMDPFAAGPSSSHQLHQHSHQGQLQMDPSSAGSLSSHELSHGIQYIQGQEAPDTFPAGQLSSHELCQLLQYVQGQVAMEPFSASSSSSQLHHHLISGPQPHLEGLNTGASGGFLSSNFVLPPINSTGAIGSGEEGPSNYMRNVSEAGPSNNRRDSDSDSD